jgi:hypothetical protein
MKLMVVVVCALRMLLSVFQPLKAAVVTARYSWLGSLNLEQEEQSQPRLNAFASFKRICFIDAVFACA